MFPIYVSVVVCVCVYMCVGGRGVIIMDTAVIGVGNRGARTPLGFWFS